MYSRKKALKDLNAIEASITSNTIATLTCTVSDTIHPKAEYIVGLKDAILAVCNTILMAIQELRILISIGEKDDAKRLMKEVKGMTLAVIEIDKLLAATRDNL